MIKTLLRNILIHLGTLMVVIEILPGLTYQGGFRTLVLGALVFMVINSTVVPLLKVMLLPLNLLTFGIFTWVVNVIALYLLTILVPQFKLIPYTFTGLGISGFVIPSIRLDILQVAIVASFLVGIISHFLQWIIKR